MVNARSKTETGRTLSSSDMRRYVLPLARAHLGDVLCTTPLPRMLCEQGIKPYITKHPMTLAVFKNNPYISGFAKGRRIYPHWKAGSSGLMLERVARWFDLPADVNPTPEVYLDSAEQSWAERERKNWPLDRRVCILSCGATTDKSRLDIVDWQYVAKTMAERYTVIQPVLSERPLPGCIAYRGLDVRQYMSLFSVADFFFGGTSGGSHVAAAFGLPAAIVVWRALLRQIHFPARRRHFKAAFLYPQHSFVPAEDLATQAFRPDLFDRFLMNAFDLRQSVRGLTPILPRDRRSYSRPSTTTMANGRFVKIPGIPLMIPSDVATSAS